MCIEYGIELFAFAKMIEYSCQCLRCFLANFRFFASPFKSVFFGNYNPHPGLAYWSGKTGEGVVFTIPSKNKMDIPRGLQKWKALRVWIFGYQKLAISDGHHKIGGEFGIQIFSGGSSGFSISSPRTGERKPKFSLSGKKRPDKFPGQVSILYTFRIPNNRPWSL